MCCASLGRPRPVTKSGPVLKNHRGKELGDSSKEKQAGQRAIFLLPELHHGPQAGAEWLARNLIYSSREGKELAATEWWAGLGLLSGSPLGIAPRWGFSLLVVMSPVHLKKRAELAFMAISSAAWPEG